MSKKFKNRPCVYCVVKKATTGDHVFARQFFMEDKRPNLPKVPSCIACNGEKAKLETYLTAVLPFGGRHADAAASLEMVPARLAANQKLHRSLAAGSGIVAAEEAGAVQHMMLLPFDSEPLERLFAYIVKGLIFHHWDVRLSEQHDVRIVLLSVAYEAVIDRMLFGMKARRRVADDLGHGTFIYEGMQGDEMTAWRFAIYGGLALGGDPAAPGRFTRTILAFTGERAVLHSKGMNEMFGVGRSAADAADGGG